MDEVSVRHPPHPGGHGVDAERSLRPGVPRERHAVADPGAHWERPAQQEDLSALTRSGLRAATPVFGTSAPARGLSGAVRRLAYRIPEHRPSRWALLLAGDRIDVIESRLAGAAWLLPAVAALGLGFVTTRRALRRWS
jgi:hypothetical protein